MAKTWGRWGRENEQTRLAHFTAKFRKEKSGCWRWIGAKHSGGWYGSFRFDKKTMLAHRVSWILFKGSDPGENFICHSCDNGMCVNPDHLWIGDQRANVHDMERKGRSNHPSLEDNGRAKLTMADVVDMRRRHAGGEAIKAIARSYPIVSESSVRNAIHMKTWVTRQSRWTHPGGRP